MIFLLPVYAVDAGGRAAWMVATGAGLTAWGLALLPAGLARRFPEQSLPAYAPRLLGRVGGWLFLLVYIMALTVGMAIDMAISVRTVLVVFLEYTPLWAITGLGLAVVVLAALNGFVRVAHVAPAFLLFLILADGLLIVVLKSETVFGYLQPLWRPQEVQWLSLPMAAALATARSWIVLPGVLARLHQPRAAPLLVTAGHWLGWWIMLPAVLWPVLVLGPEGARSTTNPYLALLGAIKIPNTPIADRPELLIRPVGNLAALITVGVALAAATEAGRALVGRRLAPGVMPALVVAVWILAALFLRSAEVWQAFRWPLLGIAALIMPGFLFMWLRSLGQSPSGPVRPPQAPGRGGRRRRRLTAT